MILHREVNQGLHLPKQEPQEMRVHARVGKIPWRRKWQPTSLSFLGKSHGHWRHAGCCPWGHKEPTRWKQLSTHAKIQFSSVQSLGLSDSLRPHELQHARPPCPSPTPGVHSDSRSSSWWCYPAISSSVVPFSSCPQSLPALESFPMSQLSAWGGQSIGVSASASVLPMNTQDWSPSKLWLLEITLMSLVSYPVALLVVCTGQTVAYMNKVMNCQIRLLWAKQWPC